MGRVKSNEVKIYAPVGFKATWQSYLEICDRDGTNASREIRKFVEGQVAKREPGNPQRTLGTYVEGHEDEVLARRSDLVKELLELAQRQGGEVKYRQVLERYMDVKGHMRVTLTESMCGDLKKLGAQIVYPGR